MMIITTMMIKVGYNNIVVEYWSKDDGISAIILYNSNDNHPLKAVVKVRGCHMCVCVWCYSSLVLHSVVQHYAIILLYTNIQTDSSTALQRA